MGIRRGENGMGGGWGVKHESMDDKGKDKMIQLECSRCVGN